MLISIMISIKLKAFWKISSAKKSKKESDSKKQSDPISSSEVEANFAESQHDSHNIHRKYGAPKRHHARSHVKSKSLGGESEFEPSARRRIIRRPSWDRASTAETLSRFIPFRDAETSSTTPNYQTAMDPVYELMETVHCVNAQRTPLLFHSSQKYLSGEIEIIDPFARRPPSIVQPANAFFLSMPVRTCSSGGRQDELPRPRRKSLDYLQLNIPDVSLC
ncbi:hypothetical protein BD779DRAFT_1509946 [Infundibulicybe gibba]|nr:hypothetical protein BD779DRAFT_1509946 [Infundibulicybe gibba]